ncbi:MAG: class I SAM-dependent methyltransferase [Synergistaceae bacterium]|jgi:2-polyprenyl-3-methyl-5-hydroxy-6-metoxy-1,4-benzoquinol methylase|nr:class I SAM-dependent methyltransferase [Synergistaceae bacterium]
MPGQSIFEDKNIEEVRAFWNARPCNIRHSDKEKGTREYFDEVERRKYLVEPHIPLFAEFARWRGKKVLEVGCGIGTDTINFARYGANVTAVDLSDASLELAQKRAGIFGLEDKITFYRANAENLSNVVPVETYDLVYSFGVIHHTPHPASVIAQVRQYMDSDSVFKIMVYNRYSWKVGTIISSSGFKFWKLDELISKNSEAQTGSPVTYTYTRKSIKTLLTGMTIQLIFVGHIFPYEVEAYKRYRYKKTWYFRLLPDKIFRSMERLWGWHLCAEAKIA